MQEKLDKKQIADLIASALQFYVMKSQRLDRDKARSLGLSIAHSIPFQGVSVIRHSCGTFNDMQPGSVKRTDGE